MSLSAVYAIPFLGAHLHQFLGTAEDAKLDTTSKDIRVIQRRDVYPLTTTLDLDWLGRDTDTPVPYLKKVSPHLRRIRCVENPGRIALPSVRRLPRLVSLTYAVPLILDTSLRRIHPYTLTLWAKVNAFLQSLSTTDNQVEAVRIVPGPVVVVRTDPETEEVVEEHVLDDRTEGSHLQLYRRYGMPVVLTVVRPKTAFFGESLRELHLPAQLMSYGMQNCVSFTQWSVHETGIASVLMDLVD